MNALRPGHAVGEARAQDAPGQAASRVRGGAPAAPSPPHGARDPAPPQTPATTPTSRPVLPRSRWPGCSSWPRPWRDRGRPASRCRCDAQTDLLPQDDKTGDQDQKPNRARRTEWARERAEKLSDAAPVAEGKGDARAGAPRAPGAGSVWRVAGMPWLLGSATLWFSGFALLLPIAPLWVIHGGSDDLGAGLVTGVMMACTVLAQLSMRRVLPGLGWRWTLVLGSGLLGLPALGHLATDRLWAVAALAALRSPYRSPGGSREPWVTVIARQLTAPDAVRRPRCGVHCPGRWRHWS